MGTSEDLIHEKSLSHTIDAVNAVAFERRKLPQVERMRVARWIVSRQGLPGAYADTFAGRAGRWAPATS